jgi:hypothetical protein
MAFIELYTDLAAADIPNSFTSVHASTRVVRVGAGKPLTFYSDLVGANVTMDLAFAPFQSYVDDTSPYVPVPPTAEDTNWYSLGSYEGGVLTEQQVVFNPGRFVVNTGDRDVAASTSSLDPVFRGNVPQGAGWMRIRINDAAGAVTSFSLSMVVDSIGYINS